MRKSYWLAAELLIYHDELTCMGLISYKEFSGVLWSVENEVRYIRIPLKKDKKFVDDLSVCQFVKDNCASLT